MSEPNRQRGPRMSEATESSNGSNPPLRKGQYVSYRDRGKTRYGQINAIDEHGNPWLSGCLAEDIPSGELVQPVKAGPSGGFVAAKKRARPHVQPPRFDSGIPCSNRAGEPVVVEPQCDGTLNADSLLRTTPAFGHSTTAHEQALGTASEAMERGDMSAFMAAMQQAMDICDFPLCPRCARAFFLGGGTKGDALDGRSGMLHSLRADV